MKPSLGLTAALLVLLAAPATSAAERAEAQLRGADGQSRGSATLRQGEGGLIVSLALEGLPPGLHGVHLHETGDCSGDGFESAGGHLDPSGAAHGILSPGGPHLGDLPNVAIADDGTATVEVFVLRASLDKDVLDADGAALVVHERPDDYSSQPSGDAGDRLACGAFTAR